MTTSDDQSAYYSTTGTTWTQIGSTETISAMNTSALAGVAVSSHNTSALSTATFTGISVLPSTLTDGDIGSPSLPGGALLSGSTLTVSGGGSDIYGTSDQFNFASQTLSDDGSVIAEITSQTNTSSAAKAGIMFCNSSSAGDMEASIFYAPSGDVSFQWRTTSGGSTSQTSGPIVGNAPVWLKLTRSGNNFTAYYSVDGNTWLQLGSTETIAMSSSALAGIAVSAHNASAISTATFINVSIGGTAITAPVDVGTSDGTNRPLVVNILDNMGNVIATDQYDGDTLALTDTNDDGVPDYLDPTKLVAYTATSYDNQGREYSTTQYSVNPTTGAISSTGLTAETWYDHDGNVIESLDPSGAATKYSYDGADREVEAYITDGGAVNNSGVPLTDWSDAGGVANDVVLEQTATGYDGDGNVIETVDAQRLNSDSNSTTGGLFSDTPITGGLDVTPTGTGAAIYYSASYYDADDRDIADENVGTNGGSVWTPPSSPDSSDATHLVTTYGYDAAGNQDTVTDPAGLVTQSYFDALGRTTETIADYTDGTPTDDSNQTTEYTYDGDGNTLTQTAVMPTGTPDQTTQYIYGVTTSGGSAINSNDLLAKVEYPDPTTGDASTSASDDVSYTYDALGETMTETDQNGTTHAYAYDSLGRETSDTAAVASGNPENIDTSVVKLAYNYNNQGLAFQQTSLNSGGGIVNQDEELYNGLGQLTNQYESVSGAVNTGSTPETQYVYATDSNGNPIDGSRETEMIYPDGRILHYGYDNSSLDDAISRMDYQADDNGSGGVGDHIADYEYQGLSTIVQQADGNGVTENISLDQFGRTAELSYTNSSSVTTDDFQYGYDQNGNVLYENNVIDPSLSELYTYDSLDRVSSYEQGMLNSDDNAIVGTSTVSLSWTYDALGNQIAVTTNGTEVDNTANSQNELTTDGSSSLAYDNDGNTATDQNGNTYIYDAWNCLISVKSGSSTIASYSYDANSHRITETHGSTTTDVYFDSAWQAIQDNQGSTVVNQYVWGNQYIDGMVLRDDNSTSGNLGISGSGLGERLYVQQDADWNTTALVDTSGTVQERFSYTPYGSATVLDSAGTSTITDSFNWIYTFQGGRSDSVTGLINLEHRDYRPSTGTWNEPDPAGYMNGLNKFEFVDSRPTFAADPSGLVLYAFDGTWNMPGQKELFSGTPDDPTNVQRFTDLYNGARVYERGIGNAQDNDIVGQLFNGFTGGSGNVYLDNAYNRLVQYYNEGVNTKNTEEMAIDVIGFSRGAALARIFVNMIHDKGIPDLSTGHDVTTILNNPGRSHFTIQYTERQYCKWWHPRVRFLGLWDTVASFGIPLNISGSPIPTINFVPLGIPDNVDDPVQIIRAPDGRVGFQSIPIDRGTEITVAGTHWDVGTSDETLEWMVDQAEDAGLSMEPLG